MRKIFWAAGTAVAAIALAQQARAEVIPFSFGNGVVEGSGLLTFVPNVAPPDPNPNCGTAGNNACRTDPAGAFAITAITGSFSDGADGIVNAMITGLVPISPANERDTKFDPLVPSSLSFIDFPGGSFTYNNLLFPDGSPIDCDYPFSGTFLDVFGTAFTVDGGYTVDLWGDGDFPGLGPTYGIGVSDANGGLYYTPNGVNMAVSEPGSLALLGTGLIGLFGLLGWRERSTAGRREA